MNKKMLVIFLILFVFLVIISLRVITGEDNWLCQNGAWVKHGNPSAQMPSGECK